MTSYIDPGGIPLQLSRPETQKEPGTAARVLFV